jgi:hypothetical protein
MTNLVSNSFIYISFNYLILTDAAMHAHLEAKTKAEAEEKDRIEIEAKILAETEKKTARLEAEEKDRLKFEAKTLAEAAEDTVRLEDEEPEVPVETTTLDNIAEILADTTTVMDTTTTGLINTTNTGLVDEEGSTVLTLADNSGMYQRDLLIIYNGSLDLKSSRTIFLLSFMFKKVVQGLCKIKCNEMFMTFYQIG